MEREKTGLMEWTRSPYPETPSFMDENQSKWSNPETSGTEVIPPKLRPPAVDATPRKNQTPKHRTPTADTTPRRIRYLRHQSPFRGIRAPKRLHVSHKKEGSTQLFMPYIFMGYVQLAFNLSIFAIFLYLVYQTVGTIQTDIGIKVDRLVNEMKIEIGECRKNYYENHCDPPESRVPIMEKLCREWEHCMNRDPILVGRAKVSAETFAEILNSFIEPISYRTMLFAIVSMFVILFLFNIFFVVARSRFVSMGKSIESLRSHPDMLAIEHK